MTDIASDQSLDLPGSDLHAGENAGLSRLGNRVLRPGGLEPTRGLLDDFSAQLSKLSKVLIGCKTCKTRLY